MCSCKAMHDPYELQHFFMARMEEGRRISKQKKPQPEAMAEMMANVLVWLPNAAWHDLRALCIIIIIIAIIILIIMNAFQLMMS